MTVDPIDIAIFLVSFAACTYCIVLSRRLKALQDTRDGLGATIMALSKSISAMSSATSETRVQAGELATRLSTLMEEADAMSNRLSAQIRDMEGAQAKAGEHATSAETELRAAMSELVGQSRQEMREMRALLKQMRSLTGIAATTIQHSEYLFDEEDPARLERTS